MKTLKTLNIITFLITAANAGGLYKVKEEVESSIPIAWSLSMNAIFDDNTNPGGVADGDETVSLNPQLSLRYASATPQTVIYLYGRLGLIYYIDEPAGPQSEDTYGQSRLGFDIAHTFDERLRYVSANYVTYELEPDYSLGINGSRQPGEYLYYATDHSLGYRWSERFATTSGVTVTGLKYDDIANADRFEWLVYNQFRYQVSAQTVATSTYRYSEAEASGVASNSSSHFFLLGVEHRTTTNTTIHANAGLQARQLDNASEQDSTNPYVEFSMRTAVNNSFSYSAFLRYGTENYDTVVLAPLLTEFAEKITLRVGLTGQYQISPKLSLFGGVNVISSSYQSGTLVSTPTTTAADADEFLLNAYLGTTIKLTDNVNGNISYNFTTSESDASGRDYDRNVISAGLSVEF